jgi:hypothetical protein
MNRILISFTASSKVLFQFLFILFPVGFKRSNANMNMYRNEDDGRYTPGSFRVVSILVVCEVEQGIEEGCAAVARVLLQ